MRVDRVVLSKAEPLFTGASHSEIQSDEMIIFMHCLKMKENYQENEFNVHAFLD